MPRRELTAEKVQAMRSLHNMGFPLRGLQFLTGVSKTTAWDAVQGNTWKHVPHAQLCVKDAILTLL